MEKKFRLLLLLALLMTAATGAWAQDAKHLITATYFEQTRSLEQPLPYATTIGELYEAVTGGQSFSYLISGMSALEMPLTGISSNNTDVVSIGELNGASTPVTVKADGKAAVGLNFSGYVQGIFVTVTPPLYVTMKDGVKDADKWTVKVGEGQAQALPIGGLKGDGSETVTLQYNGRLKVKGVKATSEAAPEVTYTLLSAATTEDVGKVVCAAGHLHDAKTAVPDGCTAVGILGKVTETGHGLILALQDATAQTWNTINGWTSVDTYAGTTLKVLPDDARGTNLTSYTALGATAVSNWAVAQYEDYKAIFENLGSTAGDYAGKTYDGNVNAYITTGVGGTAMSGEYWSATEYNYAVDCGWLLYSSWWDGAIKTTSHGVRPVLGFGGEADEQPAKEPATVTTAPTGAAIVGVGKTTALVSGGAADGGTLMYAVTTTNTKPTSTDGFSDAVPTAETLAAGTYYVWYYVKGDATHTDSEISATAIAVTVTPATITVTWNNNDITGSGKSFTKDGVTITAVNIDFSDKNFLDGGTFSTTLGNFTKIEVTAYTFLSFSGTGWSGNSTKQTWTGTPASSVSFSGSIYGMDNAKLVFTIEPTN